MKDMRKVASINQYEFPVDVTHDGEGFLAICPIWSDCYAQGDTIDEALSEVTAAAASLVELYQEEGLTIPLKLKRESGSVSKLSLNLPLLVSS